MAFGGGGTIGTAGGGVVEMQVVFSPNLSSSPAVLLVPKGHGVQIFEDTYSFSLQVVV